MKRGLDVLHGLVTLRRVRSLTHRCWKQRGSGGGTEARYNGHIKAHRNCNCSSKHCKDIDEECTMCINVKWKLRLANTCLF